MAKGASKGLFFVLLAVLTVCSSGTLVGFSYDARRKSATSTPLETVSFLKSNKVSPSQIRVSVADHRVLDSLSNTGVPVDLYLNETQVKILRKSNASAISWLKTHLITFLPHVNITSIIVGGSNSDSVAESHLPLILPTLNSIHSVLSTFALDHQVKVSVAFSQSFLENLSKKHERDLHEIIDFIKSSGSFILVQTVISGELSMGDEFARLMIETAINATTSLPYCDVPMVVTVSSSVVPSAVEIAEFTSKIMISVGNNTQVKGRIDSLFAELSPMEELEKKELYGEEQIFPSSHRELLSNIKDKKSMAVAKTILHDTIYQPPANVPTTPITNPTPTIITVPSTNPVTITPVNPATSPVTIPSTTPVTVPSTNPVNPPTVPTTNPVTAPVTVPMTPPITNPVTTYPAPPSGGVPIPAPVTTPVTNPVTPPGTTGSPTVSGQNWCVAKTGVLESSLQAALDYACGIADCSAIQQTGSCYNPNTLQSHASYAFNSYYLKNPVPTSCDFGGTAMLVNTNPSTGSCVYPTSSSSSAAATTSSTSPSSVVNTSIPAAATTTVFGSEPPPSFNSSVSISAGLQPLLGSIVLVASVVTGKLMMVT